MSETTELAKRETALKKTPLTKAEALVLVDKIKRSAHDLGVLLLEARERAADKALGYKTWYEFIEAEFHFRRQRAEQLIGLAKVMAALSAAASTHVVVTDLEARDIKPHIGKVVEDIEEEIEDLELNGHEVTPDQRLHVVKGAVAKHRSVKAGTHSQTLGESIEKKKTEAESKLVKVMDGLHYLRLLPEPQRSEYFGRVFTWLERNVPEMMANTNKSLMEAEGANP
jgi:AAA+ ATPase superfamily predicted ATPase